MTGRRELDCDEVVELVTDYLDGALEGDLTTAFQEHLAACEGCDVYLAQIRETIAALGAVAADDLPEQTRAGLLKAFRTLNTR